MFKIETHMHTKYSSFCGELDEQELVEGYLAAGYAGLVVTDHFNRDNTLGRGICSDYVQRFLEGYYRVKELGERQGLRIYKGAELRFDGDESDFLLYGYHDSLLQDPEPIFSNGLEAFAPLYRADDALLIQAHPYRTGCHIADPHYLSGVEVLNLHPDHLAHNFNERTQAFAKQWPELIQLSGSDCHRPHHIAQGGILSQTLPADDDEFKALLRSGNFALIGSSN